jgi:hypothetical protein
MGAYSFQLSDLKTATPMTPGTPVSGTLSPASSSNFYQFTATAGQSLYFARLTGSGGTGSDTWRLIDPYGNVLFSTSLSSDGGRLTLSTTGTYTVLVEGFIADTGTVSYSFNVAPITDVTQPLTLGSTANGSLATPGQHDHYTFNLATNTQLYFDSLTDNANFRWFLTGPTGTTISNRTFINSDGSGLLNPVLSEPAGAYTLAVDGTGQTAGAYAFRLSDLATATTLTPGTPVSGTLNPTTAANSTSSALPRGSRSTSPASRAAVSRISIHGDWSIPLEISCSATV